jgi:hypothetical protein
MDVTNSAMSPVRVPVMRPGAVVPGVCARDVLRGRRWKRRRKSRRSERKCQSNCSEYC